MVFSTKVVRVVLINGDSVNLYFPNTSLEAELRAFEQYWRKEVADQARINEVVKEMAKMEIKQREAGKFNEAQTLYGMSANINKPREPAEKVQKEKEQ